MKSRGELFIIAAASGTGKTSLAAALANSLPDMVVSISHTTRSPRKGEVEGQSYHFVCESEFLALIQQQAFLEYAKIFDCYYGTTKQMVEQALQEGKDVILDIDWQGARIIREQLPFSQTIFLLPPSLLELRSRLEKRKRESGLALEKRMENAVSEMEHFHEFDYLIINQNFDDALKELQSIVVARRLTLFRQKERCKNLINGLLFTS